MCQVIDAPQNLDLSQPLSKIRKDVIMAFAVVIECKFILRPFLAQHRLNIGSTWTQHGPQEPNMGSTWTRWPNIGSRWPNMPPRKTTAGEPPVLKNSVPSRAASGLPNIRFQKVSGGATQPSKWPKIISQPKSFRLFGWELLFPSRDLHAAPENPPNNPT
jgi:hypothetical protein